MTKQQAAPAWTDALGELWGSHLEELRVSLPLHRVVMTVQRLGITAGTPDKPKSRETAAWYELTFEGVTRLVFADKDTNPWWTTELTTIGSRTAGEQTEYAFELMANEDALLITCDETRVTLLQQDEYPKVAGSHHAPGTM